MDIKSHLIKEFIWKKNNGLSWVDSYAFEHYPSEAKIKWGIKASVKDYMDAFYELIKEGVIKVEMVFNGYRNDASWQGKFYAWKIIEVVSN
tara:strand:- start:79 stop:351 length:273 start_codon:yes stop_codon:yes gene_type:complete